MYKNVDTNLNELKNILGNPIDLNVEFHGVDHAAGIAYLDSLIDEQDIKTNLLHPLLQIVAERNPTLQKIAAMLPETGSREINDLETASSHLLEGRTVVFLSDETSALSFKTYGWAKHELKEPKAEPAIRGPREGFTETLPENIGIIRRWITDRRLRADQLVIGRRTKTKIAVMYLSDVAQPLIVKEVKKRISAIDIDGIVESGYIEISIKDRRASIFPQTQSTERTDKITAGILEGRVAILVDKSPSVILIPVTVNELYQSADDYFGSGCWVVEDMDRRATIIALGLDVAPDSKVMASAQIALVETSPLALGAQTPDKPFHTITSIAKTAYGTTTGLENKAVKTLFWGQLKTVVVNTALAERGLKPYCAFLERFPQIPPQCMVVLTETTSQDLLSVSLSSKFLPGLALYDFVTSTSKWDATYPMTAWQFVKDIEIKPIDAYLPIISNSEAEKVYRADGLAVFHRDRLAGKLSENESRMAVLLMDKARSANISVPVKGMGIVTFRKVSARPKITIQKNSSPHTEFLVNINVQGVVADITSDKTNLSMADIKKIESAIAESLQKDMTDTLHHLQTLHSDIIGFGDAIRANKPEVWKRLNWETEYPQASFRVRVKFNLERVGEYR